MKMLVVAVFAMVFSLGAISVTPSAAAIYPETREYMLGDIDGFVYNGAGSIDDVYADPDVEALDEGSIWPLIPFDTFRDNSILPFTFTYDLLPNESVQSATLTVAMRALGSGAETDRLFLFNEDATYIVDWYFSDISWLPISGTGTTLRSVELGNINGGDYLWLLQNGICSAQINDDTAVDYAILSIEVTPEPAALSLLAISGIAMMRCKRVG